MVQEKGLVLMERRELALPDNETLERELKAVRAFQATVKKLLIEGHDFGVIPGTSKPTLLKPGAEKIDKILHLADTYEVLNQIEEWQKGFFYYEFKCRLIIMGTDVVVSEGMGSCNSMENKYRYRWVFESALPRDANKDSLPSKKVRVKGNWIPTYRIENENPQDLANTILKMAKKRAHIDATLSAGRLSDVFTQDIEDMDIPEEAKTEPPPESQTSPDNAGQVSSVVGGEPSDNLPEEEPQPKEHPIDLDWLKESLDKIEKVKGWSRKEVLVKLNALSGGQFKSISGAADALSKEQAKNFTNEINSLLEII